jgi:tRNA G10  N-methylase Trm11
MSQSNQQTYLFICGKNWKLSLAELASYFTARGIKFEVSGFSRSFFFIKNQKPLEKSVIDELGGTLKIGEVAAFVPSSLVNEAFVKDHKDAKKQLASMLPFDALAEKMPAADSGKAVFGVSLYWEESEFRPAANRSQRFLGSSLKDALKEQGKKARFMGFPRDRENPQLTPVEVLKQGLVEANAEVLFCVGKQDTGVGSAMAVHNPFEFQKRDVEKPVQRKIFGISPRVAKIMINLGQCTAGKVFLDPFCGVGTFLQEALLAKAKVIGSDVNRWCVESARRNLAWIASEYDLQEADYTVISGDARSLSQKIRDEVDCIATEPDLGPALREVPTGPYAEKIMENLNPLFEGFLSDAYDVLRQEGFLVLVTPYIRTRSGKPVRMNIQEIAKNAGYLTVRPFEHVAFVESAQDFPLKEMSAFIDMDERHKIGREITVFQKTE